MGQTCMTDERERERDVVPWQNVHTWYDVSSDQSIVVDPSSYVSFQPVLYDWYNKGRNMSYSVCGMVDIKEPLLLIRKSNL